MNNLLSQTKCGYIAILGLPNAGKSTLLNQLVGCKVAITTPKVQTTRHRILGINTKDDTQFIFLDTPGLIDPKKPLDHFLLKQYKTALKEADIILWVLDARYSNNLSEYLAQFTTKKPLFVVWNKVDLLPNKDILLPEIAKHPTHEHLLISAINGNGCDEILKRIGDKLPVGPWLYDPEQLMEQPQSFWATEITREALFERLGQELPYNVTVINEEFQYLENGDIKINQAIVVSRESQKKIVVGQKGSMIKEIGIQSRKIMARELDCNVHLLLRVKVIENWHRRSNLFQHLL